MANKREFLVMTHCFNILPPTWLLIAIILIAMLVFFLPGIRIIPPVWNLLGLLPLLAGLALNVVADQAFHRVGTTVNPYVQSSTLVTDGVFRISRNPMYLGSVLILLGEAVLPGSITPYPVVVAFAVLMERMYILPEEKRLAEKFGEAYKDYQARTPRWM
jgi:protein-S-isoprenylcysteine O-methyltransferase Ste14